MIKLARDGRAIRQKDNKGRGQELLVEETGARWQSYTIDKRQNDNKGRGQDLLVSEIGARWQGD